MQVRPSPLPSSDGTPLAVDRLNPIDSIVTSWQLPAVAGRASAGGGAGRSRELTALYLRSSSESGSSTWLTLKSRCRRCGDRTGPEEIRCSPSFVKLLDGYPRHDRNRPVARPAPPLIETTVLRASSALAHAGSGIGDRLHRADKTSALARVRGGGAQCVMCRLVGSYRWSPRSSRSRLRS
jgi:hypothetical protein